MTGIEGLALSESERRLLRHPAVGGVILFTRNYQSPEQMMALTAEIHALRDPHLLIAIDQEGGRVQRLHEPFTRLPPASVWRGYYDRDKDDGLRRAQTCGWLMAAEMRSLGIDLSFAPVLDLDFGLSQIIGDRAFHREPEAVAALAQAYVRGMKRAGMAATGKHFPGHGGVKPDSHLTLPVDHREAADLWLEDLLPFQRLMANHLPAVMTAHVVYERVDTLPASFSDVWIKTVLRQKLGFQGVVFSDDLGMEGAAGLGDYAQRGRAAMQAGCDMVLLCNHPEHAQAVAEALPAPDPVSSLRLARLHGKPMPDWPSLQRSADWAAARRLVDGSWREVEPELNV